MQIEIDVEVLAQEQKIRNLQRTLIKGIIVNPQFTKIFLSTLLFLTSHINQCKPVKLRQ
jgi:hypothetical protein